IRIAGTLHDIGKLYVPLDILSQPGRLSEIEYLFIKTHPAAGYDILKSIPFDAPIADIIMQHHERVDGTGYPKGLKGDEILLPARIIAVADVFEAMASHRPYRASLGMEKALDEIQKNAGSLYDPDVVAACIRVVSDKDFESIFANK
ncbi:MAG: HD domain-containing protein, partial [Syntrophomonadaceae bacterium]|nr:HD domain-containing protein [Syntrophomonadaceae bacterium]